MKKRKYTCIIATVLILTIMPGCIILKRDYYSKPVNRKSFNGYLLRGSGWHDWKYGYALDDVHQFQDSHILAAVRINNFYSTHILWGLMIPLIPALGYREGYNSKKHNSTMFANATNKKIAYNYNESVTVSIAIFSKNNNEFQFNPCDIRLSGAKFQNEKPYSYSYSFMKDIKIPVKCVNDNNKIKSIKISERFIDILFIDLQFNKLFFPQDNTIVIFPQIKHNYKLIKIPNFKFKKEGGFMWGGAL